MISIDRHLALIDRVLYSAFSISFQHCCGCHVIFDEWCKKEIQETKYGWAGEAVNIDKVDFVIIIHSEGAFKKVKWQVNNNVSLTYFSHVCKISYAFHALLSAHVAGQAHSKCSG